MTLNSRTQGDIEVFEINNTFCNAEFTLFGGHILQWQPKNHRPVLWMSKASAMDGKTPIRGGIPVCWPWFGEVEGQGKHGLARDLEWNLDAVNTDSDGTKIEMSLDIPASLNKGNYPARCSQTLLFGETLKQEFTVINGNKSSAFTFALHNYFAVSSPQTVSLPFTANTPYYDKVLAKESSGTEDEPVFDGPIDRIYQSANEAVLIDHDWQRKICLKKSNSLNTVVWNPGTDAKNIADIHEGGEKEYLCMETAGTDAVEIAGNSTLTISQIISVENV